jgi:hypothetical protein
MRKMIFTVALLLAVFCSIAQSTGSITVGGDLDKFYPVTFLDGGWESHAPTELIIGRSDVHQNATWRGSLMARFIYHTYNAGNTSNFIDVMIKNDVFSWAEAMQKFIGGWADPTVSSTQKLIIVWLKGGNVTYHYSANYSVNPAIYDNVQNPLPLAHASDTYTYKQQPDSYVNSVGYTWSTNHNFLSNVGIGVAGPTEKLEVKGKIRAQEIKVEANSGTNWPDYVFEKDYKLPSLSDVEKYIKEKSHLPEVPSAKEVEKDGLALGANQAVLLKKIEELTLYMIEQDKINKAQAEQIKKQAALLETLQQKIDTKKNKK